MMKSSCVDHVRRSFFFYYFVEDFFQQRVWLKVGVGVIHYGSNKIKFGVLR